MVTLTFWSYVLTMLHQIFFIFLVILTQEEKACTKVVHLVTMSHPKLFLADQCALRVLVHWKLGPPCAHGVVDSRIFTT